MTSPSGEQPRFFFVHVMRTGGTTFEQQLRRHFPRAEVFPNPDLDFPEGDILRHLDLSYLLGLPEARREAIRLYYGHFPFVATEMIEAVPERPIVTLTLLREPVERIVSLLRVMRERRATLQHLTLEEIYDDAEVFPHLIHNHQTKLFSMTAADQPRNYLDDLAIDDARLALAQRNLERVDVIGLTERYGEFLDLLRGRFGWRFNEEARMNAAVEDHDEPAHLRGRIAADNAFDLAFYEFATELVSRRRAAAAPG